MKGIYIHIMERGIKGVREIKCPSFLLALNSSRIGLT